MPRIRRGLNLLAAALLAHGGAARADASTRVRFDLVRGSGAESCPGRLQIAQDVMARLGRDPFAMDADRAIEVLLTREPSGWSATIYTQGREHSTRGTRTLHSDAATCERLGATLGLSIALAIDPDAAMTTPRAVFPTAAPRTTQSLPGASPRPSPLRSPRTAARDWDAVERLVARVALVVGPLPSPTPAFALGFDTARVGAWRGSFGALRSAESTTSDGAFGFALTEFWGAVCYGGSTTRVGGAACAGVRAGIVHGVVRALALEPVRPGDYGWITASLAARGTLRITDAVALEAVLEPFVPVLRQRFTYEGGASIFAQPPIGAAVSVGACARFW